VVHFVSGDRVGGWCKVVFSGSVFVSKVFSFSGGGAEWVQVYCRNRFSEMTFEKMKSEMGRGMGEWIMKIFFVVKFCITKHFSKDNFFIAKKHFSEDKI